MKKRILVSCLALVLLLSGCGGSKTKKVKPMSSSISLDELDTYTVSGGKEFIEEQLGIEEDYDGYYDEVEEEEEGEKEVSQDTVTSGTFLPTLKTKWNSFQYANFTGGAEKEADEMRQKILTTGNTADYYTWSGKTYYVSPSGDNKNNGLSPETAVKSLNAETFYKNGVEPGDAILFERGGEWRMSTSIATRDGVTYGSYGVGEKPTLVGSLRNYADPSYWDASKKENVWKITVADQDIGLIVFNDGELVGHKMLKGLTALEKNGDYYFNEKDDTVYMYYDKGNPGSLFYDIEIARKKSGFSCSKDNVVIDNFRIKYYGAFGVAMCGNNNTKITNCEIGFIGGAIQSGDIRYGNGIQQWNSTDKQLIENCWLYQCYDTAITWQGKDTYEPGLDKDGNSRVNDRVYYRDIKYLNNLCEYNILDVEVWHDNAYNDNYEKDSNYDQNVCVAHVDNFITEGNIFRYTGYGWSAGQRPDFVGYSFKLRNYMKNASGCIIKNNIFDTASRYLFWWKFTGYSGQPGFEISQNTYYQHINKNQEAIWFASAVNASNQASLASAVSVIDSNPKKVTWLE